MVKQVEYEKEKAFFCEGCGYVYPEEHLAKECEEYCNHHHSCNIAITFNALGQMPKEAKHNNHFGDSAWAE